MTCILIHRRLVRSTKCVADDELSEDEVSALLRLRVLLCIPQQTVDAAHADIYGRLFEKVVKEAISSGIDGYDADIRASVKKAAHGLRLTRESAMIIASKAISSLNDMLACDKAVPSEPLSWSLPEELADLFCVYLKSDQAEEKISRLQYLLDISNSTIATLRETSASVFPNALEEEEFVF